MKILGINGPSLGLLGKRQPDVYGTKTLQEIMAEVELRARELGVEFEWFQTDMEGEIVGRIGKAAGKYKGILLNAAAYTHTSIAIRDAILASGLPCVEVHLTNISARESFRHISMISDVCIGVVYGFGSFSYILGLEGLVYYIRKNK